MGASGSSLYNIYKALIRPLLEYGCEAFDSASDSIKNKLNRVQYQSLKICTGAICRTSLEKLQVECGDPPLQLRRDFLSNISMRNGLGSVMRLFRHVLMLMIRRCFINLNCYIRSGCSLS